jgi:hypothetical protein
MKRNFVVGLFGSLVGFGMLFILLSAASLVGARSADAPPRQAQPGSVSAASPLTSTFTYQGQLKNGGNAVNGSCDLAFRLYDDPSAGSVIGSPITTTLSVNNGLFTVGLNFTSGAFAGEARWLDIRVRCPAGSGSYTILAPRQALTPAPTALSFGAPGGAYGYIVPGTSPGPYPTIGFNTYGTYPYLAGVTGYGGVFQFQDGEGSLLYYPGSYTSAGTAHVFTAPSFALTNNGNVGIGTSSPQRKLHVSGASSGLRLESSNSSTWTVTDYKTDVQEWHTGVGGSTVANDVNSKYYIYDSTAGQFRMAIDTNGNVGIGMTNPIAKLDVKGADTSPSTRALEVVNSNNNIGLQVWDDGAVTIGTLVGSTTTHACFTGGLNFAGCSSAAEYVPSIDSGAGFPETADLVSIAPAVTNPYGDAHGPFIVQKSVTACDPNLLGFIVNPESGADGEKKNDHYLPLAIYGYFPVKVTLENGAIHRGDPLTSSSKPGYAMKATQACKIIGYALEDANAEGMIQVFAHLSENAAPEVASLREQVNQLKEQNAAFEARLLALEKAMQAGGTP